MHRASPYVWYPGLFGNALLLLVLLRAAGCGLAVTTYVPVVVTGAAIFCLEWARPARRGWWPRWEDVRVDSLYMLLVQIVVPRSLMLLLAVALEAAGAGHVAPGWWPADAPFVMQVLLMLLAADFLRYWLHRACHAWAPLWRLHEVHHAPSRLYTLNVGRFHPLEKCAHFMADTLPFVLLGVAPEVIAAYYVLYSVNGLFQHANVRLRYGWLNYLVGSAVTHRWHHVRSEAQPVCNFGSTLIVWDLLFGTFRLPRRQPREVGVFDDVVSGGFLAQCLQPFRQVLGRGLVGRLLLGIGLRAVFLHAALRLARRCRQPMRRQHQVLADLLHANRDTAFGRQYRFGALRDYASFAANVPIATYEELRPYIEGEMRGDERPLTAERPLHYLTTSGTTGQPKFIPVTATVACNLRQMQRLSIALQYRACPQAFRGSLLVIAGAAQEDTLADGRPMGAASGLLAAHTPWLLRERMVLPASVASIGDATLKYLLILRLALARRDLSLCATANPGTLLLLMRLYRDHRALLIEDIRCGRFFRAEDLPRTVQADVQAALRSDAVRAAELAALGPAARLCDLWPALAGIATWTSGSAAIALARLRRELAPGCRFLELGYLASECRATLTLGRMPGSGMPNVDGNFFEFAAREAWDRGEREVVTLDALRKGLDYYVIVTTPGGLYRYFINDVVRVTGHVNRMPLLRFVQKGKGVTNLTGEKLYEAQVLAAVAHVATRHALAPALVVALADEARFAYDVYVECDAPRPACEAAAAALDAVLCEQNIEYAAKRASQRLGPPAVHWLRPGAYEALRSWATRRGQRETQFKIVALDYRARFGFDIDTHVLPEEAP